MPDYVLSGKADQDLTGIYIFSHEQFGEARADAYLLSLEERFSILAGHPSLGRRIDHIRKGYFRYEHESHSIFYRRRKGGILILRSRSRGQTLESKQSSCRGAHEKTGYKHQLRDFR